MTDETGNQIYGFKPEDWERLPDWLKTFIMESNERNAYAHHTAHRQAEQTLQDQAWKSSDFVLKTLVTVEGGSLVAILAFLGALTQRRSSLDITPLLFSLGGLGAGLVCAIAAAFCAYFVAAYYAAGYNRREISFTFPFVRTTKEGENYDARGETIRQWGIGFAVSSLVLAILGIAAFGIFTEKALTAPERPQPVSPLEIVQTLQEAKKVVAEKPSGSATPNSLNQSPTDARSH